jgi:hypothetical protein
LCKCKCGVEREVILKNLKSGASSSCGCARKKKKELNYKHGLRLPRTWRIKNGVVIRTIIEKTHANR